jgi:hypothetical protein
VGGRRFRVARDAEAPDEVAAAPSSDHAQHGLISDRAALSEHPVHDVVDGRVIAHRDEEPVPIVEGRGSERGGIRPVRHQGAMLEPTLVERPLEHRELGQDARTGIDDHGDHAEGAGHGRGPMGEA